MMTSHEGSELFEAWFCYEQNFACRWVPKVYIGEPPPTKLPEGGKVPKRSPIVKLDHSDALYNHPLYRPIGIDELVAKYPRIPITTEEAPR